MGEIFNYVIKLVFVVIWNEYIIVVDGVQFYFCVQIYLFFFSSGGMVQENNIQDMLFDWLVFCSMIFNNLKWIVLFKIFIG